jgi:hypothetical protein
MNSVANDYAVGSFSFDELLPYRLATCGKPHEHYGAEFAA